MSGAQVAHLFLRAAIGGALMTSVKQIEHLMMKLQYKAIRALKDTVRDFAVR